MKEMTKRPNQEHICVCTGNWLCTQWPTLCVQMPLMYNEKLCLHGSYHLVAVLCHPSFFSVINIFLNFWLTIYELAGNTRHVNTLSSRKEGCLYERSTISQNLPKSLSTLTFIHCPQSQNAFVTFLTSVAPVKYLSQSHFCILKMLLSSFTCLL